MHSAGSLNVYVRELEVGRQRSQHRVQAVCCPKLALARGCSLPLPLSRKGKLLRLMSTWCQTESFYEVPGQSTCTACRHDSKAFTYLGCFSRQWRKHDTLTARNWQPQQATAASPFNAPAKVCLLAHISAPLQYDLPEAN